MAKVVALRTFIRWDGEFTRRGTTMIIPDQRAIYYFVNHMVDILRLDEDGTIAHDHYRAMIGDQPPPSQGPPPRKKLRVRIDDLRSKRLPRYKPYSVPEGLQDVVERDGAAATGGTGED